LKVPIYPNPKQQKIINEWCNTSNYIYNKALEKIKSGTNPNWMNLRDSLVISRSKKDSEEYKNATNYLNIYTKKFNELTNDIINNLNNEYKNVDKIKSKKIKLILEKFKESRNEELKIIIKNLNQDRRNIVKQIKFEKNKNINMWELNTPKEVRTCAIKEVCNAYKTNFSLLKKGYCNYFNIKYKKKIKNEKCVSIPKSFIKIVNENNSNNKYIRLAPSFFKENLNEEHIDEEIENEDTNNNPNSKFLISKKTLKKNNNIIISHDCKIIKKHNKWFILIPITCEIKEKNKPINYCGVDPGIRTFLTTFGNKNSTEYNFNRKNLLKKLNYQIIILKNERNKRLKKKALTKREQKKSNIIDELHWKSINHLLKENDVIFYGDIKSHNIVSKSKNTHLKRSFNDMKFYKFKERLKYKASIENKLIIYVPENYTSQTCSFCGTINKPGCSKIYSCSSCYKNIDRDVNAAKNILMKGLLM
jgi:IS605 OrfB family transposase